MDPRRLARQSRQPGSVEDGVDGRGKSPCRGRFALLALRRGRGQPRGKHKVFLPGEERGVPGEICTTRVTAGTRTPRRKPQVSSAWKRSAASGGLWTPKATCFFRQAPI